MNILIFYSLIMSFSCAACMSTLGFCIIIFLFSGSLRRIVRQFGLEAWNSTRWKPRTRMYSPTSQYYFVLQSLEKHFPVLLCTTKFAQTTSQHYFVLQSLHKARPSTTLYYKACTKYFPVLLCTTKLAQSPSQHYFVLQSLHKALPSTTL